MCDDETVMMNKNLVMFIWLEIYPGWEKSHTTMDLDFLVLSFYNNTYIIIYSLRCNG